MVDQIIIALDFERCVFSLDITLVYIALVDVAHHDSKGWSHSPAILRVFGRKPAEVYLCDGVCEDAMHGNKAQRAKASIALRRKLISISRLSF